MPRTRSDKAEYLAEAILQLEFQTLKTWLAGAMVNWRVTDPWARSSARGNCCVQESCFSMPVPATGP